MVKNPPANPGVIRDAASIPGSGRCYGGGNGSPLQHSWLENPMDRGAWLATILAKSQIPLKRLSMHACLDGLSQDSLERIEASKFLLRLKLRTDTAIFFCILLVKVRSSGHPKSMVGKDKIGEKVDFGINCRPRFDNYLPQSPTIKVLFTLWNNAQLHVCLKNLSWSHIWIKRPFVWHIVSPLEIFDKWRTERMSEWISSLQILIHTIVCV